MLKKLFKNNWAIGIGTGVLATLALRGIDKLFINDFFWDWLKGAFGNVVDFFDTDYTVKLYFLILLPILVIALIIGVFYLISVLRTPDNGKPGFQNPDWDVYRKDVFDGIQYRWSYIVQRGDSKIINITAYCDKCSCTLVNNSCPNCKTDYSSFMNHTPDLKHPSEVETLIIHRIENNLFERLEES